VDAREDRVELYDGDLVGKALLLLLLLLLLVVLVLLKPKGREGLFTGGRKAKASRSCFTCEVNPAGGESVFD